MNIESLIPHIFLPRSLPSTESNCDIQILYEFNRSIQSSFIGSNIKAVFQNWYSCQKEETLKLKLCKGYVAFYVKEQNCGVLMNVKDDLIEYSDFQCSLDSETVMMDNDHIAAFPTSTMSISSIENPHIIEEELNNLCFTQYPQAMKQSTKGGVDLYEIRDVAIPVMMEYFKSCLVLPNSQNVKFEPILKKLRDDIVWNSALKPFRRSGMYMCLKVILQLILVNELGSANGLAIYKTIITDLHFNILKASRVSSNTKIEMLNKIGRRIVKFENFMAPNCSADVKDQIKQIYNEKWNQIIVKANSDCEKIWKTIVSSEVRINPKILTFNTSDLHYNYTFDNDNKNPYTVNITNPTIETIVRHTGDTFYEPQLLVNAKTEMQLTFALYDFENWMMFESDNFVSHKYCEKFHQLFNSYSNRSKIDSNDPFGASRVILIKLKIIYIVDKIAVKTCTSYADYMSCINPDILDQLFLQSRAEFELKNKLFLYFNKRNMAQGPNLLSRISSDSFSVKYLLFTDSLDIRKMKKSIELKDASNWANKLRQLHTLRQKCEEWRQLHLSHPHDYHVNARGERIHGLKNRGCAKCKYNKFNKKASMDIYECYLSRDPIITSAVLFEFHIPQSIRMLRDILFDYNASIGSIVFDKSKCYGTWKNRLKAYGSIKSKVELGSSVKLFGQSHYKSNHPSMPDNNFIVPCGFNAKLCVGNIFISYTSEYNIDFKLPIHKPYQCLSFCMTSTNYGENKIIASQNNCPQELLLKEYIAFGNLRSHQNLQWRHLMRYFGDLNTADPSVRNLILTATHRCESSKNIPTGDAHADLLDKSFLQALCKFISKLLSDNCDNWKDYNTLICLVFISRRISDFSFLGIELLLNIRKLMLTWIKSLKLLISKANNTSIGHLRVVLIHAYVIMLLSYGFDRALDSPSLLIWITNIVELKEICLLTDYEVDKIYSNLILRIGSQILPFFTSDEPLKMFLQLKYHAKSYQLLNHSNSVFQFKTTSAILLLNVVTGDFLVNGNYINHLSHHYTSHPDYFAIFNTVKPPVRNYKGGFITTEPMHDSMFTFTMGKDNKLQVIQIKNWSNANRQEFIFVPIREFKNCPYELLELNPWYDTLNGRVEFRRHFKMVYYYDNMSITTDTGKHLIQRDTPSYNQIINVLSAIELPEYIRIYFYSRIEIYLPRYKLHFYIRGDNYYCNELDMNISSEQVKVLIGLKNKLILENTFGELTVLIPHGPLNVSKTNEHVIINIDLTKLSETVYFGYQVDQILRRLMPNQTMESWLYLTLLHAATTHSLADPFTGITGCEQALYLLQTGNVSSCKPYSKKSIDLLHQISSISPRREYYPVHLKCMQKVTYNFNLHDYACNDSYYIKCYELIHKSYELEFLFSQGGESNESPLGKNCIELLRRAINKHGYSYTEQGRMYYSPNDSLGMYLPIEVDSNVQLITNCIRMNTWCSFTTNLSFLVNMDEINCKGIDYLNFHNSWLYLYNMAITQDISDEDWIFTMNSFYYKYRVEFDQLMTLQCIRANSDVFSCLSLDIDYIHFVNTSERSIDDDVLSSILQSHVLSFDDYLKNVEIEGLVKNMSLSVWNELPVDSPDELDYKLRMAAEYNELVKNETELFIATVATQWPKNISMPDFTGYEFINIHNAWPQVNEVLKNWSNNLLLFNFVNTVSILCNSKSSGGTTAVTCPSFSFNRAKFGNPVAKFNLTPKLSDMPVYSQIYESGSMLKSMDHFRHIKPQIQPFPLDVNINDNIQQYLTSKFKESWEAYENYDLCANLSNADFVAHQKDLLSYYTKFHDLLLNDVYQQCSYNPLLQHLVPKITPIYILQLFINDPNSLVGAYAVVLTLIQQCKRRLQYAHLNMENYIYKECDFQFSPKLYPSWVLLQLEMNVMFRKEQVDIASGLQGVTQLQMGLGKTSCILPMLATIKSDKICQIVVLKSLYYLNYDLLKYKLGYLLNKHVVVFPCRRSINMTPDSMELLYRKYKQCLESSNVIIATPEHLQSFELKCIEMCYKQSSMCDIFIKLSEFIKCSVQSVLDESDEILHYKHQLVYTIGQQEGIDGGAERYMTIEKVFLVMYSKGFEEVRLNKKYVIDLVNQLLCSIAVPEYDTDEIVDFIVNPRTSFTFDSPPLLILRGLFAYELLYHALNKRFRVNYGVDISFRYMAVPFKAKDTPTENTEFGHPDTAIVLTLLSYYQYGLSELQLTQVFELLLKLPNCYELYQKWTGSTSTINLMNEEYKTRLFRDCKYNMLCIHFYLNQFVFPKELKQFPHLLVSTGWDFQNAIGFSGTNDTELLLPNIKQNNLESLKYTNAQVLCNILKNLDYFISSNEKELLDTVLEEGCQLIIDSGALFQDSNKQVAMKWLELAWSKNDIDACLYFDDDNRLVVVDRFNRIQEYENSAYNNNLNRCLIFLDDHHTRGVDLKLPVVFKGAVTISHDMCKDKLVQSCMRMRLLGSTHKLIFIASKKADESIAMFPSKSKLQSVIYFVIDNTVKEIQSNFLNWAQAGLQHYYKECAYALLLKSGNSRLYGEMCMVPESTLLENYRLKREEQLVSEIVLNVFNRFSSKLKPYKMEVEYAEKCKYIIAHVEKYVPDLRNYRQPFNDEQQRELENEVEQEQQKYRPKSAKPLDEKVDADKIDLFISSGSIKPFRKFYSNAPMDKVFVAHTNLYVTSNYQNTVKDPSMDYYRMPTWMIQNADKLLLLSPNEADYYINKLRKSNKVGLLLYQPKQSEHVDTLINNPLMAVGKHTVLNISTLMHLFIFAGGLYFENKEQEEEYLKCIGHICKPRNEKEEEAYRYSFIKNGFLDVAYHEMFGMRCLFNQNQADFVKDLINIRNRFYDEESHVGKILSGSKNEFNK